MLDLDIALVDLTLALAKVCARRFAEVSGARFHLPFYPLKNLARFLMSFFSLAAGLGKRFLPELQLDGRVSSSLGAVPGLRVVSASACWVRRSASRVRIWSIASLGGVGSCRCRASC